MGSGLFHHRLSKFYSRAERPFSLPTSCPTTPRAFQAGNGYFQTFYPCGEGPQSFFNLALFRLGLRFTQTMLGKPARFPAVKRPTHKVHFGRLQWPDSWD